MSDNGYKIRVDDLILFFRDFDHARKEETIVNRLVPHKVYTAAVRKTRMLDSWKDVVLSEPSVPGQDDEHYYVANLERLPLPDGEPPEDPEPLPHDFWSGAEKPGVFASGDLVVVPPDEPQSWFHIPRTTIYEKCRQLPARDVSDIEFMASEEGVVLANIPKVVPQGCTCILLSLVGLRSGMLKESVLRAAEPKTIVVRGHDTKQHADKSRHAEVMPEAIRRGHRERS
jgi:hypothetical protein